MQTDNSRIPEVLCHYYENACGPFLSLTALEPGQSEQILQGIRLAGNRFASRRAEDYLQVRRGLEEQIRRMFAALGGQPERGRPHYLILGQCDWARSWYVQGCEIQILLATVNPATVSFTYGNSFPAMRYQDGKPYRGKVYTMSEIPGLIEQFGLPQVWNPRGEFGPERYIEAQLWADDPVQEYLRIELS